LNRGESRTGWSASKVSPNPRCLRASRRRERFRP